jgi:hypothetical protein
MAGPEVILAAEAIGTGAAAETAGAAMAAEAIASVNAASAAANAANPLLAKATPSALRMGMQGMGLLQQSQPMAMGGAPGIRRGQQVAQADFGQLLPQPIQRKRLSLL